MWDPQKYSGRGFRRKEEAVADSGKDIRRVRATIRIRSGKQAGCDQSRVPNTQGLKHAEKGWKWEAS